MEETSYQMVEILSFSDRERTQPSSIEIGVRNFVVKKGTMKLSGESCLENTRKKIKLYIVFFLVVLESKVQKYCSAIFFLIVIPNTSPALSRLRLLPHKFKKSCSSLREGSIWV